MGTVVDKGRYSHDIRLSFDQGWNGRNSELSRRTGIFRIHPWSCPELRQKNLLPWTFSIHGTFRFENARPSSTTFILENWSSLETCVAALRLTGIVINE
jgi:hypothetical protein